MSTIEHDKQPFILRGVIDKLRIADAGMSMRIRLFVFLIALVMTMVLALVTILLFTGPFTADRGRAEQFAGKELSVVSRSLAGRCGDTSVQLVALSQSLSRSIEKRLLDKNMRVSGLQAHPETLEEIIGNELSNLQLALEKAQCSGVFMILDATVNPSLERANRSRAGICIRNAEPELPGPDMTRRYVRGFPGIAYQNGLAMVSNWDMEFDVENRAFYHLPIEQYNETGLPLSRLYYWGFESVLSERGENTVLCSVPIIDSDGEAFGVCGFEISALNFQMNYRPDDSEFKHSFYMFSPMGEGRLYAENALFSGNHAEFSNRREGELLISSGGGALNTYTAANGKALMGLHDEIKLYPADSVFAHMRFAIALLIPKEELNAYMLKTNMRLVLICAALLALGVCGSIFISKRYLNPIMSAFDTIRSDDLDAAKKTNIVEIDQLVEQIRALRTKESPLPDNLFEDFIARVKTLTPTEMDIFRHYFAGRGGNEVLSLMYISANTLKVHNKHIYLKLGVSSKDELLLYIELIKKSGLTDAVI